jgi:hypothetical protein
MPTEKPFTGGFRPDNISVSDRSIGPDAENRNRRMHGMGWRFIVA